MLLLKRKEKNKEGPNTQDGVETVGIGAQGSNAKRLKERF